jgi:antitoxin CptB
MPVEKPPAADHARRKRAIWRAGHRGIREMDLLLGPFAKARVPTLGEALLARFEELLDEPDPDLLAWLTGDWPAPARWQDDAGQSLLAEIVAVSSCAPSGVSRA